MKLSKIKVRNTPHIEDSGWIPVDPHINHFTAKDKDLIHYFFSYLESINPLSADFAPDIFNSNPVTVLKNGTPFKVNPAKRTAAYGLFSATPQLVKQLGDFSPDLYATDQIEVGRRFNFSRWVSFVELSSATRWTEIEPLILQLFENLPDHFLQRYFSLRDRSGHDRIQGDYAKSLAMLINQSSGVENMNEGKIALSKECLQLTNKEQSMEQAKQYVQDKLPPFISIKANMICDQDATYTLTRNIYNDPAAQLISIFITHQDSRISSTSCEQIFENQWHDLTKKHNMAMSPYTPKLYDGKIFPSIPLNNESDKLCYQISLLSILSLIVFAQPPVFLIDFTDVTLAEDQQESLMDCIKKIGCESQFFIGTNQMQHDLKAPFFSLEEGDKQFHLHG